MDYYKHSKFIYLLYALFLLSSFSLGQSTDLQSALQDLCKTLYDYVSMVAFMMINLASVIYAIGNLFGAETRARANVWATSMLTGAIIGIVLIILVPEFLAIILGYKSFDSSSCTFNK